MLGAEPLAPGWKTARIAPHPGNLKHAKGRVPTPLGPVDIQWANDTSFQLSVDLPDGMSARIELPAKGKSDHVWMNGKEVVFTRKGSRLIVDAPVSGRRRFTVKAD